jgi:hypothetical protein
MLGGGAVDVRARKRREPPVAPPTHVHVHRKDVERHAPRVVGVNDALDVVGV